MAQAAAIQLPPPLQSNTRIINFNLQPPSNPPTSKDVAHAILYAKAALDSQGACPVKTYPYSTLNWTTQQSAPESQMKNFLLLLSIKHP